MEIYSRQSLRDILRTTLQTFMTQNHISGIDPFLFLFVHLRIRTMFIERAEKLALHMDTEGEIDMDALFDKKVIKALCPSVEELGKLQFYAKAKVFREKFEAIVTFKPFKNLHGAIWTDLRISHQEYLIACKITRHGNGWLSSYQMPNSKLKGWQHDYIMRHVKDTIDGFFENLISLVRGMHSDGTRFGINTICFAEGFNCLPPRGNYITCNLAFLIIPRRIQIMDKNKKLSAFKFTQSIELFPYFLKRKSHLMKKMRMSLNRHKGDHDRYECFKLDYVLNDIPIHQRYNTAFSKLDAFVDLKANKILEQYIFHPKEFKTVFLQESFAARYEITKGGWFLYKNEFEEIPDKFKKASDTIVDQVSDEKGALQLLKLIKSIPQLKFRLTIEQEKMISTPNNLLCLGRSGTGKTTSSSLRLFSTDVFYKYMEELKRFKAENPGKLNQDFKVDPQFLQKKSALKLVFVTYSPVLTNEVKKFYEDIKNHFINELVSRRERQLKKRMMQQEESKEGDEPVVIEEEEELKDSEQDKETVESQQAQDYEEYLRLEKELLQDDEEIEKQMQLPNSMDGLNVDHFPLFVTVKRLIYMLDASLDHSFFSRTNDGKIVGMDSSVEWHNETKGVFMINHYYKQQSNYEERIKKLGAKIMTIDEQLESQDVNEADFLIQVDEEDTNKKVETDGFNVSGSLSNSIRGTVVNLGSNALTGRQLSFEVDFEIFKNKFWPKVANKSKLTPLVVWTEIYSVIKGGSESYKYEKCILPLDEYIVDVVRAQHRKKGSKFLTIQEKLNIYQIYLQYENWKEKLGGYDFNDVVAHIIRQFRYQSLKPSQVIHFLMVDEVQDLTANVLFLLTTITEKNIFFCGDTAQTIAKGVGFRFYDLKHVFQENPNIAVPSVLQLTKNFRSHRRILELANSVVSLLELLFPKTIDKLMKESSEEDGPKPLFIDSSNDDAAISLLFGTKSAAFLQNNIQGNNIEQNDQSTGVLFGCNQVLIVRDQESKRLVPPFLQSMLCLTVYEAKGLEFDEVVLFNFFQDSKCGYQWMLLKDVDYSLVKKEIKSEFEFLDFENLDIRDDYVPDPNTKGKASSDFENLPEDMDIVLETKRERGEIYRQFAQLCTELKFLYVAITRPKKILIVYDQDNSLRKPLQEFWSKLGLINVITKEQITRAYGSTAKQNQLMIDTSTSSRIPTEVEQMLGLRNQVQTSKEQWRHQGIILFKKKFYQSAIQCFKNAGENQLELRCKAYEHADKANYLLGEMEAKHMQAKSKLLKRNERQLCLKEAKELNQEANKEMELAGSYFEKIGMLRHAAQCYCSSKNVVKAGQMFESLVDYGQSAECYLKVGDYRKAGSFYAKAGLFANAFECYERMQDWEGLLICLSNCKDMFKKDERDSLIEKYFPIALNQLYNLYATLDPTAPVGLGGLDEENKGKYQEMKIKLKFQKSISIIKEENIEEEEISESDEEEENKDRNNESELHQTQEVQKGGGQLASLESIRQPKLLNSPDKESKGKFMIDTRVDKTQDQEESMLEILEESKASFQEDEEGKEGDQVLREIEAEGQNQVVEIHASAQKSMADDFEVLSSLDPEDEFLQTNKSVSIIDSILSSKQESSFSVISSKSSEFSILSTSKVHSVIMSVYSMRSEQNEGKQSQVSLSFASEITEKKGDSALSLLNSSRYSAIEYDRDTYAEDIVMQKVIHYVSLFSEEVKGRLGEMRSKDILGHLKSEQNLQVAKNFDFDELGFDNQFMLIDLDNISQELLHLILDTLENYELFKLCLIICNRYNLKSEIPRFLISIGNKYSNIKNFQVDFFGKLNKVNEMQAQLTYTSIAHEAMHNVLSLINSSFLKIDEQGRDSLSLRSNCFEYLFLQGFWKKLVFLIDAESSLELSRAMGDNESFKLIYAVYKCGLQNKEQIASLLIDPKGLELDKWAKKDVGFQSRILVGEVTISEEAQRFRNYVLDLKYEEVSGQKSHNNIGGVATRLISQLHSKEISQKIYPLKRATAFIFTLISLQQKNQKEMQRFLHQFSLEQKYSIQKHIIDCLKIIYGQTYYQQNEAETLVSIKDELRRVMLEPFGVYSLDGLDLFKRLSPYYVIVKKDSLLMKYIGDKQLKTQREYQNLIIYSIFQRNKGQYPQAQVMRNFVQSQYEKVVKQVNADFYSQPLALACDLGLGYMLCPKAWADEILLSRCTAFLYHQCSILSKARLGLRENTLHISHLGQVCQTVKSLSSGLAERDRLYKLIQTKQVHVIQSVATLYENANQDLIGVTIENLHLHLTKLQKQQVQVLLKNMKHVLCLDQSTQLLPNDKKRLDILGSHADKSAILDVALKEARAALIHIGSKEKYFQGILKAYRLLALIDDYIPLLELLRAKKRAIIHKTKLPLQPPLLKQISAAYSLLDTFVYLKNNQWCPAVDSLYAFIDNSFNFIPFKELLTLIESAFYRAMYVYYATRKPSELLIPDYAMVNIMPNSKYRCKSEFSQVVDMITVNMVELKIDRAQNMNLISEAIYWAALLLETLNKDEEGGLSEKIYARVYNMLITLLFNTSEKELQANQVVLQRIAKLAKAYQDCPFESEFSRVAKALNSTAKILDYPSYLREVKQEEWHKQLKYLKHLTEESTEDLIRKKKKITKFKYGFVKVRHGSAYDKEIGKELQKYMEQAGLREQATLARHLAAANYICRIFRERRLAKQQELKNKTVAVEEKFRVPKAQDNSDESNENITAIEKLFKSIKLSQANDNYRELLLALKHQTGRQLWKRNEGVVSQFIEMISKLDECITKLMAIGQSKIVANSLDLHYLRHEFERMSLTREAIFSEIKTIMSCEALTQESFDKISTLATSHMRLVEEKEQSLREWVSQKAEPNLIEIEKKQLNIRNKWETLVQFQKRKKIMLRHLTRKNKN